MNLFLSRLRAARPRWEQTCSASQMGAPRDFVTPGWVKPHRRVIKGGVCVVCAMGGREVGGEKGGRWLRESEFEKEQSSWGKIAGLFFFPPICKLSLRVSLEPLSGSLA